MVTIFSCLQRLSNPFWWVLPSRSCYSCHAIDYRYYYSSSSSTLKCPTGTPFCIHIYLTFLLVCESCEPWFQCWMNKCPNNRPRVYCGNYSSRFDKHNNRPNVTSFRIIKIIIIIIIIIAKRCMPLSVHIHLSSVLLCMNSFSQSTIDNFSLICRFISCMWEIVTCLWHSACIPKNVISCDGNEFILIIIYIHDLYAWAFYYYYFHQIIRWTNSQMSIIIWVELAAPSLVFFIVIGDTCKQHILPSWNHIFGWFVTKNERKRSKRLDRKSLGPFYFLSRSRVDINNRNNGMGEHGQKPR